MIIYKQIMMSMKFLEEYNPSQKRKVLMVFDDMITEMKPNEQLSPIFTELF